MTGQDLIKTQDNVGPTMTIRVCKLKVKIFNI